MATFYHGYRNVTKGRNANDNINPYTHKVEKYSNWSIFNPSHVLDGAPNQNVVPGAGKFPHDIHMERVFTGLENAIQPIKNAGSGPRIEGMRYRPLENKAAGNNKVFKSVYGHAPGTPVIPGGQLYWYSNLIYLGIPPRPLTITHHLVAATFEHFGPNDPGSKNVGKDPVENPGNTRVFDQTNDAYAHQRVLEWKGVTSARAIKI